MIANERQHKIAATEIKRFEEAINQAQADGPTADIDPRIHNAMIAGMNSQLEDLREQVRNYQALREGKIKGRVLHSIRELPDALIEGRIARRFTQKQLGQKLGIPEQQIQRYEQTRYSGASIERLGEVADALQLTIRKKIDYHIPSATGQSPRERASERHPSARRLSKAIKSGGMMAGRSTGKAAASSAGKTLGAKSASKAARRAAASDLSQVGNQKKTSAKAASAAGKTLRAKGSSKAARKAAASDLSQAGRKKKR